MLSKIVKNNRLPTWLVVINDGPLSYSLDLSDKKVGQEKNATVVRDFLAQHSEITSLKLSKNKLGVPAINILNQIFPALPFLTTINFGNNYFQSETFQLLSQNLSRCKSLTSLSFVFSNLKNKEIEIFSNHFFGNQSLVKLNLMHNKITSAGVLALENAFNNNQIIQLELADNPIGYEGAKILSERLLNKFILKLSFRANAFDEDSLLVLSIPLQQHRTLTDLSFSCEKIGSEGAKTLCTIIKNNFFIRYMDISFNQISDPEVAFLAEGFKLNQTIETLNLSSNQIGHEGARALTLAFKNHTTLRMLYLGDNQMGDEGGRWISQLLHFNTTLKMLDINSNAIGREGGLAIAEGFSGNHQLTRLDISYNQIGSENSVLFAHAIENCHTIQEISLEEIGADTTALSALTKALQKNHSLTHFNLACSDLTEIAAQTFLETIKIRPAIKYVDFSYKDMPKNFKKELADILITRRKLAQQLQHSQFVTTMWILAWAGLSENSHASYWKTLPNEIRNKVLTSLCWQLSQDKSFGKHYDQLIACVNFIFCHVTEAKQRLQNPKNQTYQQTINILEKINRNSQSAFSFFQPSLKRKKSASSQNDFNNSVTKLFPQ